MKKILTITLLLTILASTILHFGCKKSKETDSYTVTVSIPSGVVGTPETGTYTHDLNDKVDYEYALDIGYVDLEVRLDGVTVENTGTITVSQDHVLQAYADPDPNAILFLVGVSDGVEGTPTHGVYYRYPGTVIDYNYTLKDKYQDLVVTLDNVVVPSSGTVVIDDTQHTLKASATLHYDIQGSWTLKEQYTDESTFAVTVTFSGDSYSGTVVDSDGGTGTFTVDGTVVRFNLQFPDVTYDYSGLFANENTMSGSSLRIFNDGSSSSGAWTGERITTTSAIAAPASHKNKGTK